MTTGRNIINAYKQYLKLFDLEVSDSYSVIKQSTSLDKFKHPLNKNQKIERIIVSLSVLGMRPLALKFLTFLKSIQAVVNSMPNLPDLEN
jgi:hypothetical protein